MTAPRPMRMYVALLELPPMRFERGDCPPIAWSCVDCQVAQESHVHDWPLCRWCDGWRSEPAR